MKAPFFFGYVLGLTIAIPTFKKHENEEGLMSIDLANDFQSLKSGHEDDQRNTAPKLTDPKQHQQENPDKTNKGSIIGSFLNIEHHAIIDSNRNQSGIHTQENGIIAADSLPDQKQINAVMYRYKFMKNNSQHKINISQRDLNIPQSINIDGMPESIMVMQRSRASLKKRSTDTMSTEILYDSNTGLGLDNPHTSELSECSSNPNSEDIYGDFVSSESSSLTSSNESDIDSDKLSDYIDSKESTSAYSSTESNISIGSRSTENETADSTDLAPAIQADFTVSYVPYHFHSSSESSNLDGFTSKLGTDRNSTEFPNNVDSSQSNEQSNSDESGESKSSSGSAESSKISNESSDHEQSNDQYEESASELSNNGVDDLFV